MKTNFRLSSKMHLFIIISCIIIAVGTAVGLICQFVANGFFNYGGDWESYKSVTVKYEFVDFSSEEEIFELCETAFDSAGINCVSKSFGKTNTGGEVVYKFTCSTDDKNINNAVIIIKAAISERASAGGGITLSSASWSTADGLLSSEKAIKMGAVAIASIIVFQFVYFAIRYKFTMALAAVLADLHNLLIFLAMLAITRAPVGSAVVAFAVLTVLLTVIGCCFLFDRVRKNLKDEDVKKLSAKEIVDKSAGESLKVNLIVPVCIAVLAAILFVLMAISSLSPLAVLSPVTGALLSAVACGYGTLTFVPSVYSRFLELSESYKRGHTRAVKEKISK